MKYKLKQIKDSFHEALNFLPFDLLGIWESFETALNNKVHEDNTDKIINTEYKQEKKLYTCPSCGLETDGDHAHGLENNLCYMVRGRRGWRELGVYDG